MRSLALVAVAKVCGRLSAECRFHEESAVSRAFLMKSSALPLIKERFGIRIMAINGCALMSGILSIEPACERVASHFCALQAKVQEMRSHGFGVHRFSSGVGCFLIQKKKLDTLPDFVPCRYAGKHSLSIFN